MAVRVRDAFIGVYFEDLADLASLRHVLWREVFVPCWHSRAPKSSTVLHVHVR